MKNKTVRFLMAGASLAAALMAVLLMDNLSWATPNAPAGFIDGQVTRPDGSLVYEPAIVKIYNSDDSVWGEAQTSLTGTFMLGSLPPGNYTLIAYPILDTSMDISYTCSYLHYLSVLLAPISLGQVRLTYPEVVGQVFAPNGATPVAGSPVTLFDASGRVLARDWSQANGFYKLGGISPGSYWVEAGRIAGTPWISSERFVVNVTPDITPTLKNLIIRSANIFGRVEAVNVPIPGAELRLGKANNHHFLLTAYTDVSGTFAFDLWPNYAGDYKLEAFPPAYRQDLDPSVSISFNLDAADPITNVGLLELRPGLKVINGEIMLKEPFTPQGEALIIASREAGTGFFTITATVPGTYTMRLTGGRWWIAIKPTTHANWIPVLPPRLIKFNLKPTPETRQANLDVSPAIARLEGRIVTPPGYSFTSKDRLYIKARNDEGRGNDISINPPNGSNQVTFTMPLRPDRYYLHITPNNPYLVAPPLPTYLVLTVTNTGPIYLQARDGGIMGTVKSMDGIELEQALVVAWQRYGERNFNIRSRKDGQYLLGLTLGNWDVTAIPDSASPYLPHTEVKNVTVTHGVWITDVNFNAITATARILGRLVLPNGVPVSDADGQAFGRFSGSHIFDTEGRVANGLFFLKAVSGSYAVKVFLPPDSRYIVTDTFMVNVVTHTAFIDIPALPKTSHIRALIYGMPGELVEGEVMVWNHLANQTDAFGPLERSADIDVVGGLWRIGARLRPEYEQDYVIRAPQTAIAAPANQTVTVPLALAKADAVITGQVLDSNGGKLVQVLVWAEGAGNGNGWVKRQTFSNASGAFTLTVPTRVPMVDPIMVPRWITVPVYRVGASYLYTSSILIASPLQIVTAPVSGLALQFQQPDVFITGTLGAVTPELSGPAHVSAWSVDGGGVEATTLISNSLGLYALPVVSNTVWHLRAVHEPIECGGPGAPNCFYATTGVVTVTATPIQHNLVLQGPFALPEQKVFAFDATTLQLLELPDGALVHVPAGALAIEGTVIVQAVPIANLPNQRHARPFTYGWALIATDSLGNVLSGPFNQNVIITFHYTEADLIRDAVNEDTLAPAYYSTTTRRWTIPAGYAVDTDANMISMQVDHFTNFGILSVPRVKELGLHQIFLPLVCNYSAP